MEGKDITDALHQLKDISEAYKINFVLSVSMDKEELPAEFSDDKIEENDILIVFVSPAAMRKAEEIFRL